VCTAASGGISGSGEVSIPYPSGYTPDNCIIVTVGLKANDPHGYNFGGSYVDSVSGLLSSPTRYANLKPTGITLRIENKNSSSVTYQYKIVLMKIT
jgi:hypothetical protein